MWQNVKMFQHKTHVIYMFGYSFFFLFDCSRFSVASKSTACGPNQVNLHVTGYKSANEMLFHHKDVADNDRLLFFFPFCTFARNKIIVYFIFIFLLKMYAFLRNITAFVACDVITLNNIFPINTLFRFSK